MLIRKLVLKIGVLTLLLGFLISLAAVFVSWAFTPPELPSELHGKWGWTSCGADPSLMCGLQMEMPGTARLLRPSNPAPPRIEADSIAASLPAEGAIMLPFDVPGGNAPPPLPPAPDGGIPTVNI